MAIIIAMPNNPPQMAGYIFAPYQPVFFSSNIKKPTFKDLWAEFVAKHQHPHWVIYSDLFSPEITGG